MTRSNGSLFSVKNGVVFVYLIRFVWANVSLFLFSDRAYMLSVNIVINVDVFCLFLSLQCLIRTHSRTVLFVHKLWNVIWLIQCIHCIQQHILRTHSLCIPHTYGMHAFRRDCVCVCVRESDWSRAQFTHTLVWLQALQFNSNTKVWKFSNAFCCFFSSLLLIFATKRAHRWWRKWRKRKSHQQHKENVN